MQQTDLNLGVRCQELYVAANSQIKLMSQLLCLKLDLPVKVYDGGNATYNIDNHFKSFIVRGAFYKIESKITDISIFDELHKWITNSTDDQDVERESLIALNNVKYNHHYREDFVNNFDAATEAAKYIDDPLVPTGSVHYRISYEYCYSKKIFVSTRSEFEYNLSYWEKNKLWFDYFGPPEDENGLIFYLDYE